MYCKVLRIFVIMESKKMAQFSRLIVDSLTWGLAFWVTIPSFRWVAKVFWGMYDPFNLVMLIMVLVLIVKKGLGISFPTVQFRYGFSWLPFLVVAFSAFGMMYSRFVVDIHIVATTFNFILLFGLVGLYVGVDVWQKAIAPFGLVLMTLPFGNIMDIFVGFPLRMWSVNYLGQMFQALGWNSISNNTIITIDNTASQIDFSCSGLKGIWAGLLFYLLLTWLDNIRIGFRWLLGLMLYLGLLIGANIFRIFVVIALSAKFKLPALADMLHAPLGIIGFSFSGVIIWWLTQKSFFYKSSSAKVFVIQNATSYSSKWSQMLVILLLIPILALKSPEMPPQDNLAILMPSSWNTQSLELSQEESKFFRHQGTAVQKLSFEFEKIKGSLLLMSNSNWQGQHNPESCLVAGGNEINSLKTIALSPVFPVKWLDVNRGAGACYWFQNAQFTTDDYGTRIWANFSKDDQEWILVSIIFDNSLGELTVDEAAFVKELHQLINNYLNK